MLEFVTDIFENSSKTYSNQYKAWWEFYFLEKENTGPFLENYTLKVFIYFVGHEATVKKY